MIQQRLVPALVEARRASEAVFALLYRAARGSTGRACSGSRTAFPDDPVWEQGLGPALHDTLLAFRRLRDAVEIIADRLSSG